jgi:hypothetical protein
MDISIGAAEGVNPVDPKRPGPPGEVALTARVLGVRPARYGRRAPQDERRDGRRRGEPRFDPPGAKVLTLLVGEGARLPPDLGSGYEVILGFRKI